MGELLINNNANVNAQDREKNTCLHIAARNSYHKLIKSLLENYPNLELKNVYNMTAYEFCNDLKTRKFFPDYHQQKKKEHYAYQRQAYGEQVLKNARSDHIQAMM